MAANWGAAQEEYPRRLSCLVRKMFPKEGEDRHPVMKENTLTRREAIQGILGAAVIATVPVNAQSRETMKEMRWPEAASAARTSAAV